MSDILQGSVATHIRGVVEYIITVLLQIFFWFQQWKDSENGPKTVNRLFHEVIAM